MRGFKNAVKSLADRTVVFAKKGNFNFMGQGLLHVVVWSKFYHLRGGYTTQTRNQMIKPVKINHKGTGYLQL